MKYKDEIIEYLKDGSWHTPSEIAKECGALYPTGSPDANKIYMYLNLMVIEGIILKDRIIGKLTRYKINIDFGLEDKKLLNDAHSCLIELEEQTGLNLNSLWQLISKIRIR